MLPLSRPREGAGTGQWKGCWIGYWRKTFSIVAQFYGNTIGCGFPRYRRQRANRRVLLERSHGAEPVTRRSPDGRVAPSVGQPTPVGRRYMGRCLTTSSQLVVLPLRGFAPLARPRF